MTDPAAHSRAQWLRRATATLQAAGVDSPAHDALQLLCHGLHISVSDAKLHPETLITQQDQDALALLLARRQKREPLAHITGTRGFWSLDLHITPDVLDPRPDTETLVEAILARTAEKSGALKLLDLGTGSGAILLALLTELPAAQGLGVDISDRALQIAKRNAGSNNLSDRASFIIGDWSTQGASGFDIIVSNPPYIPQGDIAGLAPEVKDHEPHLALTPQNDPAGLGLAAYEQIVQALPQWAADTCLIGFECGIGQAALLADLMKQANIHDIEIHKDLAGIDRVLTGFLAA